MKALIVFLACVSLAPIAHAFLGNAVHVEVQNASTTRLGDIVAKTTGGDHALGGLEPGETKRVRVHANGESSVTVAWRSGSGSVHEGRVDCYFESGSWDGEVRVVLSADKVLSARSELDLRSLSPILWFLAWIASWVVTYVLVLPRLRPRRTPIPNNGV